jgi:hypothetical protein
VPDRLAPGFIHARDLADEHVGSVVTVDDTTGVLHAFHRVDDQWVQLVVGGAILTVGAGRPVGVVA